MLNYKRIVSLCLILMMITGCSGCSKKEPVLVQYDQTQYTSHVRITVQDFGVMEFGLMANIAPSAVDSFTDLVNRGFFDNKPIYTVIKDFCIFAGANSSEGIDAEAGIIPDSAASNSGCYPFRGALCITDIGADRKSYSFTVIQSEPEFLREMKDLLKYKKVTPGEYYKTAYGVELDEDTLDLFDDHGGTPWLYGHCIVFGQMTKGEEILDRICSFPVEEGADFKPMEDIIIEKAEIF